MKTLTLSLLCAGLITTSAIAEDICNGTYQAQNYEQSAQCYVKQLKIENTFSNLLRSGISYTNLGRYKEAEKKAKTTHDYAIVYNYLSTVYSYIGDTVHELAYDMKYLTLALKSENRMDIGIAYANLGEYYAQQGQLQKELEYCEKALEYQEESQQAITYGNMALAYNNLKNYSKAEEMHQQSINIDQKTGDYRSLGVHTRELGKFYFGQHRYAEARKTLEETRTISHKAGDIVSESDALSYLSVMDYGEGYTNQAKEKVAEALRLAKQSGSTVTIGNAQYAWNMVNGK
jgi:tetratricopeptide (TPR) repeat protein